jgi:hypothetical protein
LVLGGKQSTNLRSGVSSKDRTKSYKLDTTKELQLTFYTF